MSNTRKCSSCGGDLIYVPSEFVFKCAKCHKGYLISDLESNGCVTYNKIDMKGYIKEIDTSNQKVVAKCPNCGGNFVGAGTNMAKYCEYCGAHLVVDFHKYSNLKPDGIIPFRFDKEQVISRFSQEIKKKFFIPNSFKKNLSNGRVESIYIPAFSFRCQSENIYEGKLEKNVDDEGEDRLYFSTFNISGSKMCIDDDLLIECSEYMDQKTLNEIKPFHFQDMQKFDEAFIAGYSVEHLNKKLSEVREEVDEIHKSHVRKMILRDYSYDKVKFLDINTNYTRAEYVYTLLPTYKITYSYKDKQYNTFMNGQTGKLCHNVPRSLAKILFTILGVLCILGGVSLLFFVLTIIRFF